MTNPTSNFGWQMPTATDLVTDLPADFEVFGQAVDTDFVDLLGGTTGQILSKASATDLDFTWITNDVGDITAVTVTAPITGGGTSGSVGIAISAATTSASGAVQLSDSTSTTSSVLASTPTATKAAYDLAAAATPKSTFTAKGSIAAATAASTPANLTVGANYTFLRANSAASTGLEYAGAYVTFTPTFTTGVTIGNGTNEGRYLRIGNLVHVIQRFVLGTTSSITGIIRPDFPLSALNNNNVPIGAVSIEDTGTAGYSGVLIKTAVGSATIQVFNNSTYISTANTGATVPMTWTTGDVFQISYIYETNQA